jgi:dTMP kinase
MLFTFEGIEGSGKTTQTQLLVRRLESAGYRAIGTYEPGGTSLGLALRRLLKTEPGIAISSLAELLLFAAARAQLVEEVIRPHLAEGFIVVSDRYAESTLAYQGGGRGLPDQVIREAVALATQGLKADLVILIDLPPQTGLERKREAKWDRFEAAGLDFHERVRQRYLAMAGAEPQRWLVIDGLLPREEIHETIWRRVQSLLRHRKREGPK